MRRISAAHGFFTSPDFSEATLSETMPFFASCASHCLYAVYQKQPAMPMMMPTTDVPVGSPSKKIWRAGGVVGAQSRARFRAPRLDGGRGALLRAASPWRWR